MKLSDLQQFANASDDERVKLLYQQMQAARGIAAKHQRKREELQRENAKLKQLLRKVASCDEFERGVRYSTIAIENSVMDEIAKHYA